MRTTILAPFGVALEGCSIATLSSADIDETIELVARHRVAVFRDQVVDDRTFVGFLARLGELTFTEGETPVTGAPDLNLISNVGRTTPPRSVFHTDTSYVARPPAFTALRAVELPAAGGSTLFSDQVRAAERLPKRVRSALAGRTIRHGPTGVAGTGGATRHPLFRRHPITNEVALYLSTPERCTALSGMDDARSARAVAALYRHSIRPNGLYRHAWRDGDIVVWDDRVTMHRADHDDVCGDRILHRGMVLGEVPIPA
jgi:taurine dioxygenase